MSRRGNADEAEEKEDGEEEDKEATASTSAAEPQKAVQKDKRVIRFQLPDKDNIRSEESFTSAVSFASADGEYEDSLPADTQHISFLRKHTLPPLQHSQPRAASLNPCLHTFLNEVLLDEEKARSFLMPSSSSRQLFEVMKNSPTPSDADINLINSTYLRKLESVKEAIKNGANVNTFRERQTPLLIATEIGDDRLVEYFLTVPNVNPDFQNIFGQTPLIVAVRNAFDNIVRLLLNHNADVNIADNLGKTPLHGALFQQRAHMARVLLAYGADYEIQDCFGERPMYTSAVKKPHLDCLLTLLRIGACPNYNNISGIPLLCRAILNWTNFSIIEALVQYGAAVNAYDFNTRKTPLHFAAMTNDLRVAKFLVSKGANTNSTTSYNFTAYDEAIFHRNIAVAEYLLPLTINSNPKPLLALKYRFNV